MALGILHGRAARFDPGIALFLATRSARGVASSHAGSVPARTERLPETVPDAFVSGQLHRADADDIRGRRSWLLGVRVLELSKSEPGGGSNDFWSDHRG